MGGETMALRRRLLIRDAALPEPTRLHKAITVWDERNGKVRVSLEIDDDRVKKQVACYRIRLTSRKPGEL